MGKKKPKILVYGDSPAASTGLGIVTRNVVNALRSKYDITVFGVNNFIPYINPKEFPYPIHTAGINEKGDPFGSVQMVELAQRLKPDAIISTLDMQVVARCVEALNTVHPVPHIIYCPVDGALLERDIYGLDNYKRIVTYTEYGRKELKKWGFSSDVVPLGCDTKTFHPMQWSERNRLRREIFGVGKECFVVMSVARNQWRKDLARTMEGFKKFKKKHPEQNTLLYLHAKRLDIGGDLLLQAKAAGLDAATKEVVFTPKTFSELLGVNTNSLNALYTCADVVVSTSLGEGWGLSTTEAFATRTPFVGPRNTSIEEIVGKKEERGYLAKCSGKRVSYGYDDHLRPVTDLNSFVGCLEKVMLDRKATESKVDAAFSWVQDHTWEKVTEAWPRILEEELG